MVNERVPRSRAAQKAATAKAVLEAAREEFERAASIRDDIRRLDWRVFARTDKYYIKEFEADSNANFSVLLDVSKSMLVDDVAVDAQEWLLVDPRAGLVRLTGGPAGVVGGTLYLSGHQAADWSGIGDYGPAVTDQRSRYCWEYTGGYGLAGSSDTPALPLAIQFAAIDAIRPGDPIEIQLPLK